MKRVKGCKTTYKLYNEITQLPVEVCRDFTRGVQPETTEVTSLSNTIPDWLKELRRIPEWPRDAEVEEYIIEWDADHPCSVDPLLTATALVSKWPGNKSRPYKDPVATFKNWRLQEIKRQPSTGPKGIWA